MQLQDIVTNVRKTIGEPEPNGYGTQQPGQGTWDNSQIIGYINQAMGLVAHVIRAEGSSTITLDAASNVIPLPADCLEDGVRKLVYNAAGALGPVPIRPISLDEFEAILLNPPNSSHYTSRFYTVWGRSILLYPYPITADTVTLFYYQTLPNLVAATDVPGIPARFHVGLEHYATARCQQAIEESGLYQLAMGQWQGVFNQIRAELSRKSRDRNRVRPR